MFWLIVLVRVVLCLHAVLAALSWLSGCCLVVIVYDLVSLDCDGLVIV